MPAKIFLILLLHLFAYNGFTQSKSYIHKAYAYYREVFPGVAPSVTLEENGSTYEKVRRPGLQHFIYAELSNSSDIAIKNIWINGKKYFTGLEKIKVTPVILSNPNNLEKTKDTLVPKSFFKICQIHLKQQNIAKEKKSNSLAKATVNNEVVIEYLYNKKLYYYNIRKIKKLPPLALQ